MVRQAMSSGAQYYRPPRRVPSSESKRRPQRSRTQSIIFLFGGLIVASIILFGVSFYLGQIGLHSIALAVYMFAVILIWVSIGVGFAVGLTYYVMQSFLKREFNKRFDRMDKERHERYRRMMGLDETDDEDKK